MKRIATVAFFLFLSFPCLLFAKKGGPRLSQAGAAYRDGYDLGYSTGYNASHAPIQLEIIFAILISLAAIAVGVMIGILISRRKHRITNGF